MPSPQASTRQQVTLLELDRFSEAQLHTWDRASKDIETLNLELHYGLEKQRHEHKAELLDALRANRAPSKNVVGWHRIVPLRYSHAILSCVGSLRGDGGRFNIGNDLASAGFKKWPALYLAENLETAFREKFGLYQAEKPSGLTPEELSLSSSEGWTVGICEAYVDSVFDIGNAKSLEAIVKIFARFKTPAAAKEIAKRLKIRNLSLVRTVDKLWEVVLDRNWRILPSQFDLPSHSQMLGQLILEAGFEAIEYPSTRNGSQCLAILPTNFGESNSFVQLSGALPDHIEYPRLDRTTLKNLV